MYNSCVIKTLTEKNFLDMEVTALQKNFKFYSIMCI